MAAATIVLKSDGLHNLSFEAVAAQAGLSRQLVRYYFPTIEQLMVALCNYYGTVYSTILTRGVVDVGVVERLPFFMDFFFGLADQHEMPDHLEVYDALVAYAVGSSDFRETLCNQYKTLGQVMSHELAIAYPDLSVSACEELSYLFVSMMHAHWSFVASLGHNAEHGRLTRQAIDRLITSYRNDSPDVSMVGKPWARAG